MPALWRLRQAYFKPKGSLDYTTKSCLKQKKEIIQQTKSILIYFCLQTLNLHLKLYWIHGFVYYSWLGQLSWRCSLFSMMNYGLSDFIRLMMTVWQKKTCYIFSLCCFKIIHLFRFKAFCWEIMYCLLL